ncbi:MGDG synthase family glycosyltransferase [Sulfobacillus thermosulfidooxidans]|uniref:MGDG synthase family glycosyltransferase n=1 Tax=Sulfobacillus thermosulfidooxidans TaxID=28034 RepID=UPI00041A8AD8|nr:glycosyltransferase [Sulfobacillus thermosulfidooxidans]
MRILIASLPIGTGHDIAAKALAEACLKLGMDVEFSEHLVGKARIETGLYFWALKYIPRQYGYIFRWGDHSPLQWAKHRQRWMRIGQEILNHVYDLYEPDIILATHPFALNAWAGVKEIHSHLKLVGVLTDLSVHRFWYEPLADAYTVWLPEQVEDLARFGVKKEQVWQTGIPIRSSFHEPAWELPLYAKDPIVLLGGGLGMGPYYRILRKLAEADYPVVAVCGHNERLRWHLDQYSWPDVVTIVGYVEKMPLLLHHSRLVVGKPGGVTAAEVAQSHVPFILTHWIPGQEEANRDRLLVHDMAVRGDKDLLKCVRNLLPEESPLRRKIIHHQELWARPHAASDIANRLLNL